MRLAVDICLQTEKIIGLNKCLFNDAVMQQLRQLKDRNAWQILKIENKCHSVSGLCFVERLGGGGDNLL